MIVAIASVLARNGFFMPGCEYAMTLLGASIALLLTGPGRYAVDTGLRLEPYTDNRGMGEVTFTLIRGQSTVSGTWKMRTGGGGPVTGIVEPGGRRILLRMENIAFECPGTFEGSAEITETTFVGTYHGQDCEGQVTSGRLELRSQ